MGSLNIPAMDGAELSYRSAGVDRDAAHRAKQRILDIVASTTTEGVVPNPGGFGGLFRVPRGSADAVLVSSADGVGTKLKVASLAGRHEAVGLDIVNHCVNDILVEGARPLFFLDYLGMGRLEPGTVETIVAGVAAACRANGCALLGGETAEMPDVYAPGEYDLAGFVVGVVDQSGRPGAHRVRPGHALVGLGSDGFHTNGYSLLRRLFFDTLRLDVSAPFPGLAGTVADILLRPHRSYLTPLLPRIAERRVLALAHITGGGIPGNLDRIMPDGLSARVDRRSWTAPAEFGVVAASGRIEDGEMLRTFNMGVGMIAVVEAGEAGRLVEELVEEGERAWVIGRVEPGQPKVVFVGGD